MDLAVFFLGNPGKDYQMTRHNLGFLAGENICNRHDLGLLNKKFNSIFHKGQCLYKEILFCFPQTYMNLSGEAVSACMRYFDIPPSNILVVYDEVDLPFGQIRLREKGSAGTHNGMKSIVQHLGTQDFPRLRLGFGPAPEHWALKDFVLGDFSRTEQKKLPQFLDEVSDAIEVIIKEGASKAMNSVNVRNRHLNE